MNQYPGPNPYAAPQAPAMNAGYAQAPYAASPAVRVEGPLLVAANGAGLPAMCLKCGGPPHQWKAQKYMYVPAWARMMGWLGVLIFSKKASFQLPLCNDHRAEWKKWNLIAWLAIVPPFLLWIIAMAAIGMDSDAGPILFFAGLLMLLADLITVVMLRNKKIVTASKIDKTHAWLKGVHPTVLQFVSNPQGPQGYAQPQYAPQGGYGPPQGGYGPPPGGYGPPPGGGYGGPPPQGWGQ
jgi:hypothetical protein